MVTYGFYNSIDHDRRYNALQMSSIFDGIVRDGIFMSIGTCFRVNENVETNDMRVLIGPGRAWFDHTWTLNDAQMPLEIPQSEVILNRIDAIVIEVNADPSVRANAIKVIKGTPATNPVRPAMVKTEYVHQYPLAFVSVRERVTHIRQADITNMIGTSEAPFVTGILDTVNIDMLVAQWGDQWKEFFERQTADMTSTNQMWKDTWHDWFYAQTDIMKNTYATWVLEWETFKDTYENEMIVTGKSWKDKWETWFYAYVNDNSKDISDWKRKNDQEFNDWWNGLKSILDENCCSKLTQAVLDLSSQVEKLNQFKYDLEWNHCIWGPIFEFGFNRHDDILDSTRGNVLDSNGEQIQSRLRSDDLPILDSNGDPIEVRIFVKFL